MNIFTFNANNELEIDDGVAYSSIQGGSATFTAAHMGFYVGRQFAKYVAMLVSNGVPVSRIAMLLAVRAAIGAASRDHPEELPFVVDNVAGVNQLMLNGAEMLRDHDLAALTNFNSLRLNEWINPATYDGRNPEITRVSGRVRTEMERPYIRELYQSAARMAYSVLAINGMGLIQSSHHCSGAALNAAIATMELYNMKDNAEAAGEDLKDLAAWFFHDSLHAIDYRRVTQLVNSNTVGFMAKVASTILKRFPVVPGGSTFLIRAIAVRKEIFAYDKFASIRDSWEDCPSDMLLVQLYDTVIANPIQFSKQLSSATAVGLENATNMVVDYCISLFGIYDTWLPPPARGKHMGPTAGPGIRRMIAENGARYNKAKEAATAILAEAPALNPLDFLDEYAEFVVPELADLL